MPVRPTRAFGTDDPDNPGRTDSAVADGLAVDPQVLRARAYLSRVAEPPAPALAAFLDQVGPVDAATRVARGDLPDSVAAEIAAHRTNNRAVTRAYAGTDAVLAAADAAGIRLLVPEHPHWPRACLDAFTATASNDAETSNNDDHHRDNRGRGLAHRVASEVATEVTMSPVALWVRGPGRLDDLSTSVVAVTGSRAATGYGIHVAAELAAGLAQRGRAVISGAALGVDGAAHRGALTVAGPRTGGTVAVLACGLDRPYPVAHAALLENIVDAGGLIVSEYPPGAVPTRRRFRARNRLVAALGTGLVVVETSVRGSARHTAACAAALGRPVMAIPGPITSACSAGCHRLLQQGAVLVTSAQDICDVLSATATVDAAPTATVAGCASARAGVLHGEVR